MSGTIKQLRGQLRQLVKEILPDLLTNEIVLSIEKKLTEHLEARLNKIDERQKQLQGYMVRQSAIPYKPEQK